MGKLAVVGATAVVGGGTAVGGMALSKMFSFDSTLPKELKKFQEGNGGGCVQSLFPGLQSMSDSGINDVSSNEISNSFLDQSDKEKVDGCLVINWDRDEYQVNSSNKGKGNFRFLGAVQHKSKGFIVFTTAETTNDSDKKLHGKGIAYSLEKKEGELGKLSKKKSVSSADKKTDKKTDKTSTDSKFPKPHSDLSSNPFWGFMKSNGDMDNMCDSGCTGSPTSHLFQGYWVWKGSSESENKNLGKGTSNSLSDSSNSGWEELFGKSEWDMNEVVKDMTGKGEEKVWYGIDRS